MFLFKVIYKTDLSGKVESYFHAENFNQVIAKFSKNGIYLVSIEKIFEIGTVSYIENFIPPLEAIALLREKTGEPIEFCRNLLRKYNWDLNKVLKTMKENK